MCSEHDIQGETKLKVGLREERMTEGSIGTSADGTDRAREAVLSHYACDKRGV